jgi:hypothetical protein
VLAFWEISEHEVAASHLFSEITKFSTKNTDGDSRTSSFFVENAQNWAVDILEELRQLGGLVELTEMTLSTTCPIERDSDSRHAGVQPPQAFGIDREFGLPGSSRSGEKMRKISLPIFNPRFSLRGFNSSSVVPG